jgi:hypothetical protein
VFKGVAAQNGSWRVEMLEMHRPGKDAPAGINLKGMSICMDNVMQLAKQGHQLGARATAAFAQPRFDNA